MLGTAPLRVGAALSLWLYSAAGWADYALNMRKGVTELSRTMYDLHMLVLWICVVIGVVVFGLMLYSMICHRRSRRPVPATFHESLKWEWSWTVIAFLILVAISIPATRALLHLENSDNAEINIKVTGYQWKWRYDYIDEGIGFFSSLSAESNRARQLGADPDLKEMIDPDAHGHAKYLLDVDQPLVVPVGKKIRFLVTANDVIHSWWVPDFGVKQDAVPGYINDAWAIIDKPGVYRGQCAELCGKDHGFMPIVVEARSEADYAAWLAEQKAAIAAEEAAVDEAWDFDRLMQRGAEVYRQSCAACHGPAGESAAPAVFPSLKGSAIAVGPLEDHLDIVLRGSKTNPAMAAWDKQLKPADLAAVITYERNAWGNQTGDVVQPADIVAAQGP